MNEPIRKRNLLRRRDFLQLSAAWLASPNTFDSQQVAAQVGQAGRIEGGWYTRERVQNARQNIERFSWAKELRDRALASSAAWMQMTLDELWKKVPGQSLPRTMDVVMTRVQSSGQASRKGCPACQADAGYRVDFWKKPFQVACTKCGEWFPKNDFSAYYESGRDETGLFNPQRADRNLLTKPIQPGPQIQPQQFAVDDGWGYRDSDGFTYRFIAHYADQLWGQLLSALTALGDAFTFTGEGEYARRCAILLDRIADVYPEMDWSPFARLGWYHSDGDSGKGKIFGRISECVVLTTMAQAYDKIGWATRDDQQLWQFLGERGRRFRLATAKGSWEEFCRNIEERVLNCGLQAIQDERIRGNRGYHETAAAWSAIAWNQGQQTEKWLNWIFSESGLQVPKVLVEQMDRDGMGAEGAPGYSWGWGIAFNHLAELLEGYGKFDTWRVYRDFPLFRQVFTAPLRMALLNRFVPNIGDFGSCMNLHTVSQNESFLLDGFRRTSDPKIAQAIVTLHDGKTQSVRGDIFDRDPEAWRQRIEDAARHSPPLPSRGRHLPGFGLVSLEHGEALNGCALWMYYGRNHGHGHQDCLNLGLIAHGVDLLPDLGYPDFATRFYEKRKAWTSNTLSHNTVVVDKLPQEPRRSGKTRFVKLLPGVRVAEFSTGAYSQAPDVRRMICLIEAPNGQAYAWDIFRVNGGRDHLLSFHGPEGEVTAAGATFQAQTNGTYAGQDVRYAARIEGVGVGNSYLTNVRNCPNPPAYWTTTWNVAPRWLPRNSKWPVGLRLHHLTNDIHDVALCDNPNPSQRSVVEKLTYVLQHRSLASQLSDSLSTTFVTLLEPFRDATFIREIRQIATDLPGAVALEVTLADGIVDILFSSPQSGTKFRTETGWSCDAAFAHVRTREGRIESMTSIQGSLIESSAVRHVSEPAWRGTVLDFDSRTSEHTTFVTELALPTDGRLNGETVVFDTDADTDAAYRIHDISRRDSRYHVSVGRDSFALGYRDSGNFSRGFRYAIAKGTSFTIANHKQT